MRCSRAGAMDAPKGKVEFMHVRGLGATQNDILLKHLGSVF